MHGGGQGDTPPRSQNLHLLAKNYTPLNPDFTPPLKISFKSHLHPQNCPKTGLKSLKPIKIFVCGAQFVFLPLSLSVMPENYAVFGLPNYVNKNSLVKTNITLFWKFRGPSLYTGKKNLGGDPPLETMIYTHPLQGRNPTPLWTFRACTPVTRFLKVVLFKTFWP